MRAKKAAMQMNEAIYRLSKKTDTSERWQKFRSGQQFSTFLKRRNAVARKATPKGLEDHEGKLKWMTAEFFPW